MSPIRRHKALSRIWGTPKGWRGTLVSVNHSDIGKRFILAAFFFFAVGGVLAMLIRAQLATPHSVFVGPDVYNQLFTMHGSIMMFLFAIPMFEGLALYLLPKMLGSRDMAFPRLSAFGWWCYLFGGSILLVALAVGAAPDGGWFMYTPLSGKTYTPGINADVWLLGITFVEISAVAAAVEITVSILKLRAPGMSLDKMPLFAWYLLVTALMMVAGFPPLILGSVLLEVERAFDWPFFDEARGGDSLLWQHLFWLFGHPEVYIIFLPAAGVVSTVLPVMARTKIMGYGAIVGAILALGVLSFGLWVHHMFTTGIPHMALGFFSAASALVAIPTGVQIFAWIGTLWNGRPDLRLPMLYLIGFFFVFILGGLTGVMLAVVPFDQQAHDSYFVVAHLHYVLVGGFIFPMLAGAYYWLPHFTGRRRVLRLGETAFWLIFVGFNLTFFLMHLTGLLGMPRRVYTYPAEIGWTWLNLLSSVGSFVMAFGFALFAIDVALQIFLARPTKRNPWKAGTLEWAMPLPSPVYNLASIPHVESRDPIEDDGDLANRLARGEGYLAETRNNWREVSAVDVTTGRFEHVAVVPGNTPLPIVTAFVVGLFVLSLLFGFYWLSLLPLAGVVALAWVWASKLGTAHDRGLVDAGRGTSLPLHWEAREAPGWWGTVVLLWSDGAFLGSLLFGYAFLWTVAPNWPPAAFLDPGAFVEAGLALGGAALAALAARAGLARFEKGEIAGGGGLFLAAGLGHVLAIAGLMGLAFWRLPPPTGHAYAAVGAAMIAYAAVHAFVSLVMCLFVWRRAASGHVSQARTLEPRVANLFGLFSAVATGIMVAALVVPVVIR
ncbi:MAG: cytochrome c oxidase subunit I [Mesorhizobium amorphae]|nr:MAG: cytochrome c oxidase subunit I [Mesorhizobium amorphae]